MISIVLCTYNRVELLASALESLCNQTFEQTQYEILVVDNNSTDGTRDIVADFSRQHRAIRYCRESAQGLSHARNRGWREARGDYVGYTDDDCRIPCQWLQQATRIIDSLSPDIFGGPYFAFYNSSKPDWFKDSYGSRRLGIEARFLCSNEFLSGGNIFFRRSLLEKYGGFQTSLGMQGKRVAYGEEVMLQRQIRAQNPDQSIYYDPKLYVYHLVRPEKMTLRWLLPAFFAKGKYVYLASLQAQAPPKRSAVLVNTLFVLLPLIRDLTLGSLRRDREEFPFIENYLYEHVSQYLRKLGKLFAQYQQRSQRPKYSSVVSPMEVVSSRPPIEE